MPKNTLLEEINEILDHQLQAVPEPIRGGLRLRLREAFRSAVERAKPNVIADGDGKFDDLTPEEQRAATKIMMIGQKCVDEYRNNLVREITGEDR